MAQSVEHHLGKVEVPGSNPGNSSKQKYRFRRYFCLELIPGRAVTRDIRLRRAIINYCLLRKFVAREYCAENAIASKHFRLVCDC